jgi:hypothetical protein
MSKMQVHTRAPIHPNFQVVYGKKKGRRMGRERKELGEGPYQV